MPNNPPTAQEILDSASDAQGKLTAQEKTLQNEIQNIDDVEFDHPLTDEQKKLRENLRTAQKQCRAGMAELAFVTLAALDNSAEVQKARQHLQDDQCGFKDGARSREASGQHCRNRAASRGRGGEGGRAAGEIRGLS